MLIASNKGTSNVNFFVKVAFSFEKYESWAQKSKKYKRQLSRYTYQKIQEMHFWNMWNTVYLLNTNLIFFWWGGGLNNSWTNAEKKMKKKVGRQLKKSKKFWIFWKLKNSLKKVETSLGNILDGLTCHCQRTSSLGITWCNLSLSSHTSVTSKTSC